MSKLREAGDHVAHVDQEVYIEMGWLEIQIVRVVADIYHSKTIGFMCNVSHIIWKCNGLNVEILHKIPKERLERIEWECIKAFRKKTDIDTVEDRFEHDSDTN